MYVGGRYGEIFYREEKSSKTHGSGEPLYGLWDEKQIFVGYVDENFSFPYDEEGNIVAPYDGKC
jgi:hypothetical protein